MYSAHCGLDAVHFTWTATEYLTMVLLLNQANLPFEAIFLLRFQNFDSAIKHGAYRGLYGARDEAALPLLHRFVSAIAMARSGAPPPGSRLTRSALTKQCNAAVARYFPEQQLEW